MANIKCRTRPKPPVRSKLAGGSRPASAVVARVIARGLRHLALVALLVVPDLTHAEEAIECGEPLAGVLESGETSSYRFNGAPGAIVSFDVSNWDEQIGLIRLHNSEENETCSGNLRLQLDDSDAELELSDCIGAMSGSYTLTANVVSDSPSNCSTPLPCGSTADGYGFELAGEVDSFSFNGDQLEDVVLRSNGTEVDSPAVRLRVFDPDGMPVRGADSCAETLPLRLPKSGRYTVLVSACGRQKPARYRLTFEGPHCQLGPHISYFGVAQADDRPTLPEGFDAQGRPIFSRPLGQGFELIVEGRPGMSRIPVGKNAFTFVANDPLVLPDLQILVSRPLGLGTGMVCDNESGALGGIPAKADLAFGDDQTTANAVNDLGCRVNDGRGIPQARLTPGDACTRDAKSGDFRFVDPRSTTQFCLPIARSWAFPPGDTIVRARLRDEAGLLGETREIVVRAGGSLPFQLSDLPPDQITASAKNVYFTTNDGSTGTELWRSDGTVSGTQLVRDLYDGQGGSFPRGLTALRNSLYFIAQDASDMWHLWATLTESSYTAPVSGINVGVPLAGTDVLFRAAANLFYFVEKGSSGFELWKSDGQPEGSHVVESLGLQSPMVGSPKAVGSSLYFTVAREGAGRVELWRSDGSQSGTGILEEFAPVGGKMPEVGPLFDVNGDLYFIVDEGPDRVSLWRSEGSSSTAAPVVTLHAGGDGSIPTEVVRVGNWIFFAADDGQHGIELWRTDGTPQGSTMVTDLFPGPSNSAPTGLTELNGDLLFAATTAAGGRELWRSDGTASGTAAVRDIVPGPSGSSPQDLTAIKGLLYFSADDGINGRELWQSDGSEAGTVLALDVAPGRSSSNPSQFTLTGGRVFFSAAEDSKVAGLWAIPAPAQTACAGDCDNNRNVTIDEILRGINVSLGEASLGDCTAFDLNADHIVTVDELLASIRAALDGC